MQTVWEMVSLCYLWLCEIKCWIWRGKKSLSLNFAKLLSVSNNFPKLLKPQYLMRGEKKEKSWHHFRTKMALKKDAWSKAWSPDGISCKRERSSFTCNLLFSAGPRISTGSSAINSQMVKMNCPTKRSSYCTQLVFNHDSLNLKLSFLKPANQNVCWVGHKKKYCVISRVPSRKVKKNW